MYASIDWNSLAAAIEARLGPTQPKMALIADFALGQVRERFASGGASGGQRWAPTVTPAGKIPPLEQLQYTYRRRATYGEAVVFTNDFRCYVAQLGTRGKGGALPDVVPRPGPWHPLFIPLTNVGLHAYWERRSKSPALSFIGGGHYFKERPTRLFGGHPGPAIEGVDYIFRMRKADDPRPQLPVSAGEIDALKNFVGNTLNP